MIDAAEYVGPYDDEKLGFNRIARFYYYPGWWEYAPSTDIMVNARAWDGLPAHYKHAMEAAGAETWHWAMTRWDQLNPPAMRRLLASGTQLRPYSREIMTGAYKASQDLYAELGDQNPRFRKVWEHWEKHRIEQTQWFRVAEDSMANFVAVASVSPR